MKRISLIPLLFLFLLFSCSKKELTQVGGQPAPASAFIDISSIKNEKLVGFAKELNRQDSLKTIQVYFGKKYGNLLWDQALIQQQTRDVQAIVPITKSGKNTAGFLICRFTKGKYSFELFDKGSVLSNGYVEKPGKLNNYQVQTVLDYFNARLYNITSRRLLSIMDIADTAQRRKLIEQRGNTDVGGLYVKYSFPKSNATVTCITLTEPVEIWWNPNEDACNCDGDEYYHHTEYHSVVQCIDYGQGGDSGGTGPSGGEGNGGTGGNTNPGGGTGPDNPGNPGNPGSPGGAGTDPNINWLYPPGSFVSLGDNFGTYSRPGDWLTQLTDYWNNLIAANYSDFAATNLLTYGSNRGWAAGIVRNRKCGKLFEEQALKYFGFPENKRNYDSPLRTDITRGTARPMTKFRPDHIDGIVYDWTDDKDKFITTLDNYFLTEVKATSGVLQLNTSNYQIQAEVDFLKKRRGEARAAIPATVPLKCEPIYFLITTSDATIGNDIISYAIQNHIWIWTSYSKYKIDPVTGSPVLEYTWPVWVVGPPDTTPRDEVPMKWLSLLPSIGDGTQFAARQIISEPEPNFDTDPEEVE